MRLRHPAAALTLTGGGNGRHDLASAAVRRVRVDLSVDEAHDRVQVWAWDSSALAGAAPGDTLAVALGDGDGDPKDVLLVDVAVLDREPGAVTLTGLAPSHKLSFAHVGRSWRQTTLGQVVQDLLDDGGVAAGDVAAPLALPALHVDPGRSVWSALHDLARRTGYQVTSTADGKVSFGPAPGVSAGGAGGLGAGLATAGAAAAGGLGGRSGLQPLAYRAGSRLAYPALDRVNPAAASSWFLLAAGPDDGAKVQVIDPALRTREAADAGTAGAGAAASRAGRGGRVRVLGSPQLRAGASTTVGDDSYRILQVTHLLDADSGYVCDLVLEGDS